MYEAYYGVRERPFDLTPNPRFLLLTGKHREALSNLQYGLMSRRGLTVLVGEAGTGKTTLIRAAVGEFEARGAVIAYLNNPTLTRQEFCEFLTGAFRLDPAVAHSKTRLLSELAVALEKFRASDVLTGLIIDEAQALPDELLEEVRLLANIETATDKLLPIVLAGQPELADRLNQPSLRQLKQRVALRCQLNGLESRETAEYIAGRIRIAGGNSVLVFTRQAVESIYAHSGGIPRLISVICDNALISGFAANRRPVSRDIVEDVCRDFDLIPRAAAAAKPAVPAPPAAPAAASREQPADVAGDEGRRSMFEHFTIRRRFSLF
jgi:type II secretory pathway predicted ATPase ExeA